MNYTEVIKELRSVRNNDFAIDKIVVAEHAMKLVKHLETEQRTLKKIICMLLDDIEAEHMGLREIEVENIEEKYGVNVNDFVV